MIYLDNAATTKYKPEEVYAAFEYYIREIAVSPGRGSYQLGIEASRMLFQVRNTVAKYFGLSNSNVIFTKNSTEAINMFLLGFLKKGDHVVISCYEHNSVLRPIQRLKNQGIIDYTVITRDDLLLTEDKIYSKYINKNTSLFISTLASNLTGRIVFNSRLAHYMRNRGIVTFIDASQGAGKIRLSLSDDGIDYLAFTGHKDLLALPGVGGLACLNVPKWEPLLQGGTGVLGDSYINPSVFPDGYEAGTINMPAVWSLKASIEWLDKHQENVYKMEQDLTSYFIGELKKIPKVIIYDDGYKRVGTVGVNIQGLKSNELVQYLDKKKICVRGGIHCAILAHEALGTKEYGMVRFSLGWNTKKQDIDIAIQALREM